MIGTNAPTTIGPDILMSVFERKAERDRPIFTEAL